MCGIFGFIGKSRSPRVSYEISHALMIKTEIRGDHATGFWACERDSDRVFYDKEPIKSSIYATRDIWSRDFSTASADLLLGHCRYSSVGVGHERHNKNNHPHVSSDLKTALVHNGKIPEYGALRQRYQLRSDCDSEILLSMFESGAAYKNKEDYLKQEFPKWTPDIAYRMMGLREIFSRVNYGAMAVAIGERGDDGVRHLWLFRDDERPLHVIDLRQTLGQIFFCSTAEIWRASVDACPAIKPYIPEDHYVIEFPALEVWLMATTPEDDAWKIKKFRINKTKFYDWRPEDDREKPTRPTAKPTATIVSRLDSAEDVISKRSENAGPVPELNGRAGKKKVQAARDNEADVDDRAANVDEDHAARDSASGKDEALKTLTPVIHTELDMAAFSQLAGEVRSLLNDLEVKISNLIRDGSVTDKEFSAVLESMKDASAELKATILYLEKA